MKQIGVLSKFMQAYGWELRWGCRISLVERESSGELKGKVGPRRRVIKKSPVLEVVFDRLQANE